MDLFPSALIVLLAALWPDRDLGLEDPSAPRTTSWQDTHLKRKFVTKPMSIHR